MTWLLLLFMLESNVKEIKMQIIFLYFVIWRYKNAGVPTDNSKKEKV